MFLELSSIMKARQEVYGCFEMSRTLQAAKDERHYLLSCLRVFIIVCSWQPHDWLDSWRNFWDLKLENEGGNWFSFKAAINGRVEPQLLLCRKLPIFAFSQHKFVWILQERVVVALLRRLHRSCWGNLQFFCVWLWRYVSIQCLLSVVFLALWFVNFLHLQIFFIMLLMVFSLFGLVWTRCLSSSFRFRLILIR